MFVNVRHRCRALLPHAALFAVQVASILYLGQGAPLAAGFPLDDAWIHQIAARNLAEHGTLGVIPGVFGSGTTSLLWVVLLAPNHALLHWPPQAYTVLLAGLLHAVAGQVVLRCARLDGWRTPWAFLFAALFSVSPNATWFVFSGMEVCLATALLLVALLLWFAPGASIRSAAGAGVALALLVLTRPESVLLCAALIALAPRARRPLRHALVAGGIAALAEILSLAANLLARGHASPSTLGGRRWLWMQEMVNWPWYEQRLHMLGRWSNRLWVFTLAEPWDSLFWILVALSLVGAWWCWTRARRTGALVVLLFVQVATYLVLLPSEGHGGRYQPLIASLFLPLACVGGRAMLRDLATVCRAPARVAGAVTWLVPAAVLPGVLAAHATWARSHALAVEHVVRTEVATGQWISKLPEGTRVASFDIGAISYFAGRHPIVDLGGLSDPSIFDDVVAGRLPERLRRERVEYLVMPMPYADDWLDPSNFLLRLGLVGTARPRVERVAEFSSPFEIWFPGVYATLHCSPRQVVFRIAREEASSP